MFSLDFPCLVVDFKMIKINSINGYSAFLARIMFNFRTVKIAVVYSRTAKIKTS